MVSELVGKKQKRPMRGVFINLMAEWTGLEPATPGVTGRYSNQLNYRTRRAANIRGLGRF